MSPEVWERQPYEFGCDVWSLGCLLFEMAALEPPFQGSSMRELRIQARSAGEQQGGETSYGRTPIWCSALVQC